jgi:DNA-directed RNA polymerase specialized sigma54-like protein
MGQQEVYEVLVKAGRPLSRKEIAMKLKQDESVISRHIRKLIKHKEIDYIKLDRTIVETYCKENGIPRVKQRMRLYYVGLTQRTLNFVKKVS